MVDFSKLKPRQEYDYVTYRCQKCGVETEYVHEMPPHLLRNHYRLGGGWCGGREVEVRRRKVSRKEHLGGGR